MINFFKLADSDASLTYLGNIFGSMGGLLPSTNDLTMLSTMFSTFNATVLAVGALIIVYMTVVGVMATAHEGEFMGKKWNNLWIPIRTVLGIATLVPTASGYSAIQIVMMWIIMQGVAAADTLWSTTLAARAILGTPYDGVTLPDVGASTTINGLFTALVCDASARMTTPNPSGLPTGGYYCNTNTCSAAPAFNPDASSYQFGPNGSCGTLTYCDSSAAGACKKADSMACVACQAQIVALQNIIPTLGAAASAYVNADYIYRDFYYNSYNQADNPSWQPIYDYCENQSPAIPKEQCCNSSKTMATQTCQGSTTFPSVDASNGYPGQNPSTAAITNIYWPYMLKSSLSSSSGNFIDSAVNEYMATMTTALSTYIKTAAANGEALDNANISIPFVGKTINASSVFEMADQIGWIFAGSFYYTIATEGQGSSLSAALPDFSVTSDDAGVFKNYRINTDGVTDLISAASAGAATGGGPSTSGLSTEIDYSSGGSSAPKIIKTIIKPLTKIFNTINKALNNVLTVSGGPLNALQAFGQIMILTGEALYIAILILSAILGSTTYINVYVLGTGADSPIWGGLVLTMMMMFPLIFALIAWLISFGGILAVYLPLIPYIVFLVGVIGWFIAVIEAMVAAPLVALGILSPSGQHELLGKAEPALMLIFNIFLRPSLMIFGLIAAMLLVVVVFQMILSTFAFVTLSITHGVGLIDPVVLVLFITALISLLISAANKCFTMIYLVPAQVMQWIGGSHHTPGGAGGEEGVLGEAKGAVSQRGQSIGGSVSGASKGVGDRKDTKAKRKENIAKQQGGASITGNKGGGEGGGET